MSEVLLAGVLNRETEFVNGLTGACGPNAAHTAVSWAKGGYVSTYSVYRSMHLHTPPLCDANGVSNMGGINAAMGALGLSVGRYEPYSSDYYAAWRSFIVTELNAGRVVVIELSHGQNLHDYISNRGENAVGLRYHFIAIVGYNTGGPSQRPEAAGKILPNGWWAADGDNFAAGDVLQFYPDSVLNNACPCCALSVNHLNGAGKVLTYNGPTTPAPTLTKGTIMIPAGWTDNGADLTAPNGLTVGHGFRFHIESSPNWPAALVPLTGEYTRDGVDVQDFGLSLAWVNNNTTEQNGFNYPAQVSSLQLQLATLQQKLTEAQGQVTSLTGQLNAANQEITALKNQPAPVAPAPAPDAVAALAYVQALKAAKQASDAATQAEAAALAAVQ